jgi:hypothetical protein
LLHAAKFAQRRKARLVGRHPRGAIALEQSVEMAA